MNQNRILTNIRSPSVDWGFINVVAVVMFQSDAMTAVAAAAL